jgi:outer membrane protein TolC
MKRIFASVLAVTAGLGAATHARATTSSEPRGDVLTLDEVIRRTLGHDPKAQAAQATIDEAVATRQSIAANYGPKLQVDGTLFYWNSPREMTVVDPKGLDVSTVPPTLLPFFGSLLNQVGKPIRFRDSWTSQLQVSVIQPITPLYAVHHGQKAAKQGEIAAGHQREQIEREATYRATESYYHLLAAQHLYDVANEAVATLTAHLDHAKQYRDAEMLGLDEYLAVEVELGNAVENKIKARTQRQLAQMALATLMGWSGPATFAVADIAENAEPPLPASLDNARKSGLDHRSEIAALAAMAESSHEQAKAAWWQLTPQASALARYQHTTGSAMDNTNEWFAGGVLSWSVWDWGASYYKARAAEAQMRQLQARQSDAKDLIDLEVTQRFLAIEAARERLSVARMTQRQAGEALRVARMKFDEHTVASTAVLDAQTRLSRAQANRINAQYDLILAVAALRLSMGEGAPATVLPDELVLAETR